jgi:hypothetical protein
MRNLSVEGRCTETPNQKFPNTTQKRPRPISWNYLGSSLEGMKKTVKIISETRLCPGRDSKPALCSILFIRNSGCSCF